MNNSQKIVYIIAAFAIALLIVIGVSNVRIYTGKSIESKALISLNTEDAHGVDIVNDSKLVSFESGFVYNLELTNLPYDKGTISLALPITRMQPNKQYSSQLKFDLDTNIDGAIGVKSNSGITSEQTSFETDLNYKPTTIAPGGHEYLVEFEFETNEEGIGYIIFDFPVTTEIDDVKISLSNILLSKIKEVDDVDVDSEQTSETTIQIGQEEE